MDPVTKVVALIKPIIELNSPISGTDNNGKRRRDLASFALISDAYLALCDLEDAIKRGRDVSADLLVRYIYEVEMDFLFLFQVKKGAQSYCDAYIEYGNLHHAKILEKIEERKKCRDRWLAHLGRKAVENSQHWSGLKRSSLTKALRSGEGQPPIIYSILSGFAHPGIFTLERTARTTSQIYENYSEINRSFAAYMVSNIFVFAAENKLYGVNVKFRNTNISDLRDFIAKIPSFSKKGE